MNPLVVAEHGEAVLAASTLSALAAATQIASPVSVLVMGVQCDTVAKAIGALPHVERVHVAEHDNLKDGLPEHCAKVIAELAPNHSHILMAAGSNSRNWLPRAAALVSSPMLTDVIAIKDHQTFVRPTYAGKALETVSCGAANKFLSIRATAFETMEETREGESAPIQRLDGVDFDPVHSWFKELRRTRSDRPDLASAQIVVSAGRGVGGPEGFEVVAKFADSIGAALGASRAAVDAGYAPNDFQVGQTGKVVAPELYIAVGISGAIQHVAGILDSGIIVAINKDENAPIFEIADYGLVGDFKEALPRLQGMLANKA